MNRLATPAAVFVIFVFAAFAFAAPLAALESPAETDDLASPKIHNQDGHEPGPVTTQGSDEDVIPRVVWMLAGVAASAVTLSVLYLLKRRVGGFPENPSWVAPITIMPSSQLPGDTDSHHEPAPGH